MNKWRPIARCEIESKILIEESEMNIAEQRIWKSIRVGLAKWEEASHGNEGGWFWVSAIVGNSVIWYNDIEDGWNISTWSQFGVIDEYLCDQLSLRNAISRILFLFNDRTDV